MGKEKLVIGKKEYDVELKELKQADLKFYTDNPRVYSILNFAGVEPSQDQIQEHMCSLEHVKQLKVSIESNGGLIDPLIVRDGDYTVLEGNSRLAAYRLLCEIDPVKWGNVRCQVLPADISEDTIFALLGQYHIIGRKDWEPFEQAHYLYRRHRETRLPIEFMAKELGVTKNKAEKMIGVIEFMIEKNDLNKRHWSYYEEYLKNAGLKTYRESNPELDDTITKKVVSGEIKEASDIRKLGDVAKVNDKQSQKLIERVATGTISIYDAYDKMLDSGKLDDALKKLSKFRELINNKNFETQLTSTKEIAAQARFEIKKITNQLERILESVDKVK